MLHLIKYKQSIKYEKNIFIIKRKLNVILISSLLVLGGCITKFIPKTNETKEFLVVEGLITNKPDADTIKLSKSLPLGSRYIASPVTGCTVTISDDHNNTYYLTETNAGKYVTDRSNFQGQIGRFYTLHINTNRADISHNFESIPVEMKPVPPIDSVFYTKVTLQSGPDGSPIQNGCQVYINTHDPTNNCRFYRWEYAETWEFIIPFTVPNNICWISENSKFINIKKTSELAEDKVEQFPLYFISNESDRLKVKYSVLVNQYSLNEDEYNYWEKLQNLSQQTGGLYDLIPSAVESNIYCLDDPNEKVQGYFSVSACSSKRIFIKDNFAGLANPYSDDNCVADTIHNGNLPSGLNTSVWIIASSIMPSYVVITYSKGCYDCTVRGTKIPPDFWIEDK